MKADDKPRPKLTRYQHDHLPEVVAESASGRIHYCEPCRKFTLEFAAMELTLAPHRLLQLHRVIGGWLEDGPRKHDTRVRITDGVKLRLTPELVEEFLQLLDEVHPRAAKAASEPEFASPLVN